MPLGRHKRKWELLSLIMIILLIVTAFALVMKELFMQENRPALAELTGDHPTNTATATTSQDRRLYRRPLNMHDPEDSPFKPRPLTEQMYAPGAWMPNQTDVRAPASASLDTRFPAPSLRRSSGDEESPAKGDKREDTGWGWLADDIAADRRERGGGTTEKDDRSSPGREQTDNRGADAREDSTTTRSEEGENFPSTREERSDERQASLFMNEAYSAQTAPSEAGGMRPALRETGAEWSREVARDAAANTADEVAENTRLEEQAAGTFGVADEASMQGFVIRDPFASAQETGSRVGGWTSSRPDAFSGLREGGEFGSRASPGLSRAEDSPGLYRPSSSGQNGGLGYGLSTRGEAPSSFSSESMFGAPGMMDGSRSDALYSGGGLFNGDAAFRSPGAMPATPQSLSQPASGIGLNTPGALPW